MWKWFRGPLAERLIIAFMVSIFVVGKPLAESFREMAKVDAYNQLDFATLTIWSPLVAIILTCYHAYRYPMNHFWDQLITAAGMPAVILAFWLALVTRIIVMNCKFAKLIVLLLYIVVGCGSVAAQSLDKPVASSRDARIVGPILPEHADFKKFNFVQKVRLASTKLINPKQAEMIDVVYVYDASTTIDLTRLWKGHESILTNSGAVKWGVVDAGVLGYSPATDAKFWAALDNQSNEEKLNDAEIEKFLKAIKSEGAFLISSEKIPALSASYVEWLAFHKTQ